MRPESLDAAAISSAQALGADGPFRESGLRARRAELVLARRRELEPDLPRFAALLARRWSRALAGLVAAVGFVAMGLGAALIASRDRGDYLDTFAKAHEHLLTGILLGSVASAIAVWLVGAVALRKLAAAHLRRRAVLTTDDLLADIARLERRPAAALAGDAAGAFERSSTALPLIALALLAPLTLHFVVYAAFLRASDTRFDWWIMMSFVLVGHSHVVLSALAIRFARRLHRHEPVHNAGWLAWLWCWISSLVPGFFLVGIPTAIVLLTGLAFVPASFSFIRRRVFAERALFGGEPEAVLGA